MAAPAVVRLQPTDYMAALRALNRMRAAGFTLTVRDGRLIVTPADRLTTQQDAFLRVHKPALVALLNDAETLYAAHLQAGVTGLAGREGVPPDWTDSQWLAASQLLHSQRRIKTVLDRRYLRECAPPAPPEPDIQPDTRP